MHLGRLAALCVMVCGPTLGQEPEPGREHSIPLFMANGNAEGRQGFIRIINHSDEAGTVEIVGVDDMGMRYGPVDLTIEARETKHLNSEDVEIGNDGKGLPDGLGDGEGDWRLLLYGGALDIEPLAYIRTPSDGFLTSMHDVVPEASLRHRVPIFNPGKNMNQESLLRLINPGGTDAPVTITGRDDAAENQEEGDTDEPARRFELTIPAGGARLFGAAELEGDADDGIGVGVGKWSLDVVADVPIQVMNLMSTPTFHLSNLSGANPGYRGATGLWQVTFDDEEGGDGYIILLPDSRIYAWLPEANEANRIARGTFKTAPDGIEGEGEVFQSGEVMLEGLTPVGGSENFTFTAEYRSSDWIRGEYTVDGIPRSFRGWAFTGFERGSATAAVTGLWEPVLGEDADLSGAFEPEPNGEVSFEFTAAGFTCNVDGSIGPINPAFNVYEAAVMIRCVGGAVTIPTEAIDLIMSIFDAPDRPGSGNRAIVLAVVHNASKLGFGAVFRLEQP